MHTFFAALLLLPAALRAQEIHAATYNVQQPSDAQSTSTSTSTPASSSTPDSQDYRTLYPYPSSVGTPSSGYPASNTSTSTYATPYSSASHDCATTATVIIQTNPTSVIYSVTGTGYLPTGSGVPGNQTGGTTYNPPTLSAPVIPSGTPPPPPASKTGEPLFPGAASSVRVEGWMLGALVGALVMGL